MPAELVNSRDVTSAQTVVLASDGYPKLAPDGVLSHDAAEAWLQAALKADPECTGLLAGTKALAVGLASFDDRAWLHLQRA